MFNDIPINRIINKLELIEQYKVIMLPKFKEDLVIWMELAWGRTDGGFWFAVEVSLGVQY